MGDEVGGGLDGVGFGELSDVGCENGNGLDRNRRER
jgi:hypothetical protein